MDYQGIWNDWNNKNNNIYSSEHFYDTCRSCFLDNYRLNDKIDVVSLNLYAYLASWGMLRNSFLKHSHYRFLNGLVEKVLFNDKYKELKTYDALLCSDINNQDIVSLIIELKNDIKNCFLNPDIVIVKDTNGEIINIKSVTDTFISKIILGTFGCTPAYDRYLCESLKAHKICQTFNEKSIEGIINYVKNTEQLIRLVKREKSALYTSMKVVDTLLWGEGFKIMHREKDLREKEYDVME